MNNEFIYDTVDGISGDVKYWITGYSLGGAISNLLSAFLTDDAESGVEQKDVFTYTFSSPNTVELSESDTAHKNIHKYFCHLGSYKAGNYTANIFVMTADESLVTDTELTYYLDGESKKGRTDAYGLLKIAVSDGSHSVSLDKKTEVYINNYSGAGVDVTVDFPRLIYSK